MQGVLLSPLPAAEAVPPRSPLLPPLRRIHFLPGEGGGCLPFPVEKRKSGDTVLCREKKRKSGLADSSGSFSGRGSTRFRGEFLIFAWSAAGDSAEDLGKVVAVVESAESGDLCDAQVSVKP